MKRLLVRRISVVLAFVVVVIAATVMGARPAAADPLDLCKDAPAPTEPKAGMAGLLTERPTRVPDGDPFAAGSKVGIGDVYGYGWHWSNYDLGCGNDFLRDPVAVVNTQTANQTLGVANVTLALLDSAETRATDTGIGWLTLIVGTVAEALKGPVLGGEGKPGWLPLAVVAVGALVAFGARRADYAATMRALIVVGLASAMAVWTLVFPYTASKAVDDMTTGAAKIFSTTINTSITDSVDQQGTYRTWLQGYFGDADSELAKEYGPRLVAATHYSWAEMDKIAQDPGARKGIDAAKASEFKKIAGDVENKSPTAYETFTGRGDRTGIALTGVVTTILMALFGFFAFLMIAVGRIMMQALVVAAPVAAVIGVLPPGWAVLRKMWDLFTAALVGVAKFILAAGVMSAVLGGLNASDLATPTKLFWIVVATVVGFALTKPMRTFKTMTPGLDPNQSYLRNFITNVASAYAAGKGVSTGLREPGQDATDDSTQEPDNTTPERSRAPQQESMPPLPPNPTARYALDAAPREDEYVEQLRPQAQEAGPAPAHAAVTGSRTWSGVTGSPARPAVTAGPTTSPQAAPINTRAGADESSPSASVQAGDSVPATAVTTSLPAPASTPTPAPAEAPEQTPRSAPSADQVSSASAPAPNDEDAGKVVYPTGIIIQHDPTLYRGGEGGAETYIKMPEPELDGLGEEHDIVLYTGPESVEAGRA